MNDVIVRYVLLPDYCNGFLMEDPGGDANIYVNKNKSEEIQKRTVIHESIHWKLGHLRDLDKPVAECEAEAEKGASPDAGTSELGWFSNDWVSFERSTDIILQSPVEDKGGGLCLRQRSSQAGPGRSWYMTA